MCIWRPAASKIQSVRSSACGPPEDSNSNREGMDMNTTTSRSDAIQPGNASNALVALYLTEETGLPCNTKGYEITSFETQDSAGARVQRRALRVTYENGTSIKQPLHLLTIGSDDQQCNVILKTTEASPIHCKIYAQLNSGPDVWVMEDNSVHGTVYVDEESRRTLIPKMVVRGRVAAHGLCRIQIGRNIFGLWSPSDGHEKLQREHWFSRLDPILVTQEILQGQLCGATPAFCQICQIGDGGMADVVQYMERTTGLMIAVKEEKVEERGADERVQKEIAYMRNLRHPNLVEYITSHPATNAGVKTWFTAMPLYQGRLCDVLPLEISAIEEVMLQLFDGVHYMHEKRVLHKDIKPQNILVKAKSRPDIVLADYGICASLDSRTELRRSSGTAGFAAPEVSQSVVQTTAVDVFALGATFFFTLEPERFKGHSATLATLRNVMLRPPRVYAGLVQSMMAHDAQERPSVKDCFDIVRAKQRDWRKQPPLAHLIPSAPSTSGLRRSQRIRNAAMQKPSILDISKFAAPRPRLTPIAKIRQPQNCLGLQHAPRRDFKAWVEPRPLQGRKILDPSPAPKREPQPPAPVQRVNFAAPPPPTPANPFADLNQRPDIASPPHRQAPPATQEPARTPIHKSNSEIKRRIRRGPERRKMVERWHNICVQSDRIRLGVHEIDVGIVKNLIPSYIFSGLRHITAGGLGVTGHWLGMFQDLAAARRAINHIAPYTKNWGMTTEEYLMYGFKPQKSQLMFIPLPWQEYERERLDSESKSTEKKRTRARLETMKKTVPEEERKRLDSMLRALPPLGSPGGE